MRNISLKFVGFAAFLAASCVSQSPSEDGKMASKLGEKPQSGADYSITWREDYPNREFDLTFVSKAAQKLCLSDGHWPHTPEPGGWPYRAGSMSVAPGKVYVLAEGRKYPIKDSVRGVCDATDSAKPDLACSFVVEPGEHMSASIPFDEFEGLPSGDDVERTLVFDVVPRFCGEG